MKTSGVFNIGTKESELLTRLFEDWTDGTGMMSEHGYTCEAWIQKTKSGRVIRCGSIEFDTRILISQAVQVLMEMELFENTGYYYRVFPYNGKSIMYMFSTRRMSHETKAVRDTHRRYEQE